MTKWQFHVEHRYVSRGTPICFTWNTDMFHVEHRYVSRGTIRGAVEGCAVGALRRQPQPQRGSGGGCGWGAAASAATAARERRGLSPRVCAAIAAYTRDIAPAATERAETAPQPHPRSDRARGNCAPAAPP